MTDPAWARPIDDGWEIDVRVQPGSRRSEVVGALDAVLKIRIAAPAVDGKANAELVRFVAQALGVRRRAVEVVRGAHSRTKTVRISGPIDPAGLQA